MAVKVGEGFVEVETRVDEDNFVRASRAMAQRAALVWGKDYSANIQRSLRDADQQFDVHINRQISSFQNLERQRVRAAEDTTRRLKSLQNDIASATEKDRRISDAYEAEGKRAADKFTKEQNASFDRVLGSYRKGLASLGDDTRRTFSKVHQDIDVDVDRHSHTWARTLEHNLSRGIDAALSLMPGRMEALFSGRGGPIGLAIGGAIIAGVAAVMPAIGAMISGIFFAALGTGVVAAGIALVAGDSRVVAAAKRLKQMFTDQIWDSKAAEAFVQATVPALDKITAALKSFAPQINMMLTAASQWVGLITEGGLRFIEGFIGPLTHLMTSDFMTKIMKVTSEGFGKIGKAFGDVFDKFLNDPQAQEGALLGLDDAFNLIAGSIKFAADVLVFLSKTWKDWNTDPDGPGPLVSKIDRMRELWHDFHDGVETVVGLFSDLFTWLDKIFHTTDNMKSDWHDLGQIIDGISGKQKGETTPQGQDFNGDAAGLGDASKGFWSNQWDDIKAESAIAWDSIKAGVKKAGLDIWQHLVGWGNSIKSWWNDLWDTVSGFFETKWNQIVDFFKNILTSIGDWFTGKINAIKQWWDTTWGGFKDAVVGAWDSIVSAVRDKLQAIYDFLKPGLDFIGSLFKAAWQIVVAVVLIAWKLISIGVETTIGFILAIINGALEIIKMIWNVTWTFVKDVAISVWNAIWGVIGPYVIMIRDAIVSGWNTIKDWTLFVWNLVVGAIRDAWNFIVAIVTVAWETVKFYFLLGLSYIEALWDLVWGAIKDFVQAIWDQMVNIIMTAFNAVKDFLSAALETIKNTWNTVWGAIKDIALTIWDTIVKGVLTGINSVIDVINGGINALNALMEKLSISYKIDLIPHVGQPTLPTSMGEHSGGHAMGGRISGPGGPTDDKIHTRLSDGEFVIRTRAAQNLGYQNLDYMNRTGKYPGYAGGGRVGPENDALLNAHRDHLHVAMPGGWESVVAKAVESKLPFVVGSTVRPGDRGSSGNLSWHHYGKAVDFPGVNQDSLASFFMNVPGVLEEIHRTDTRDYAIFGGKGGGFLNEFFAKGIDWIMTNMLDPIINGLISNIPDTVYGRTTKAVLSKVRDAFKQKIMDAISASSSRSTDDSGSGIPGGTAQWQGTVVGALARLGYPDSWAGPILQKMQQESGGNPRAINLWDVNAQRGDPSRGLMQVIGSTFTAYRDPALSGDIYDPLANVTAAIRYIVARYGTPFNLPAGGYDQGGYLPPGIYNGTGTPEPVFNPSQWDILKGNVGQGWNGTVNVYVDGVEVAHRAVVEENNFSLAQDLYRGQ